MRHRESGHVDPLGSPTIAWNRTSMGGSLSTYSSTASVGTAKESLDCLTPDYFAIKKTGGILPFLPFEIAEGTWSATPNSYNLEQFDPGSSTWWQRDFGQYHFPIGTWDALPDVLSYLSSAPIQQVVNGAVANAKSGNWDVITSLAEVSKSVRGIARSMDGVFSLAHDYASNARRRFPLTGGPPAKRLRQRIREFNSLWLEGRYQWRPLVGEISDIMDHLESEQVIPRHEGKAKTVIDLSSSTTRFTDNGFYYNSYVANRTGTLTVRGWCMASGRITSIIANPFLTAWELAPYSFIVDKFVDVGSAIQAMTPLPGVDIQGSGYSAKFDYVDTWSCYMGVSPSRSDLRLSGVTPGVRKHVHKYYKRYPWSASIIPPFYPRLKPADLLDIAALVSNRALRITKILGVRVG